MQVEGLSYTTTPLSEYIASKIYQFVGIDVHETKLGISNGKVVVACKDFLNDSEVIFDYNAIKNEYDEEIEQALISLSSSSSQLLPNALEEIKVIMENNFYFKLVPELRLRFWDMFVMDAFLSNNDRNEGNWGLVYDRKIGSIRISPVFDNGASFYNKASNDKLHEYMHNPIKFKQVVYDSAVCIFSKNEKIVNPLKYIESRLDRDCNEAILRIVPKINLEEIGSFFDQIPEKSHELAIFSKEQKEFYFECLRYKYTEVLYPVYCALKKGQE